MKNNCLIVLLFLGSILTGVQAQTDSTAQNAKKDFKNVIYGGIGCGGIYFPGYLYYEYALKGNMWGKNISSFATIGGGAVAHWDGSSQYAAIKYGFLFGKGKPRLELSAGLSYFFNGDLSGYTPPFAVSIGYRSQTPNKRYVFRAGGGWPEAAYVSWGFRF